MARARQCDRCKSFAPSEAPAGWYVVEIVPLVKAQTQTGYAALQEARRAARELCGICSEAVRSAMEYPPHPDKES